MQEWGTTVLKHKVPVFPSHFPTYFLFVEKNLHFIYSEVLPRAPRLGHKEQWMSLMMTDESC